MASETDLLKTMYGMIYGVSVLPVCGQERWKVYGVAAEANGLLPVSMPFSHVYEVRITPYPMYGGPWRDSEVDDPIWKGLRIIYSFAG